jgi:hypothetical protein
MPILAGDIKLVAAEVMDDVDEGGGAPTAIEIEDGASNAIFSDVSELDRAGGDVSLRKAFVSVQTPDTDKYLGSNVIIADKPADPLVSVTLFSTGETFDRRIDAQNRIESYLGSGPEWAGFLLENHITGQSSIRLFQRVGSATPTIGSTLILVYNEGLSTERLQYVRVTDVSAEEQTFTHMSGSTPEDYLALVVTLNLSDSLREDFPGSPPARNFQRATTATKVRETVVANAARYYGVSELEEEVLTGDITAKVASIFTQLVPSAQTEIPLLDLNAAGQADAVVDSSTGTITYNTTLPIGGGTAIALPNAITPETLVITTPGGELTDFGGQLYSGADVIGTVDYPRGTVTLLAGTPTYTGSKSFTFKPAAAPLVLADTAIVAVTVESRAFNYVQTFTPAPSPGTLVVSYRSGGRWYDLRDNGSGQLRGSDASFGVGTISYSTGTVAVTLGALPDVDSAILYAWGARPNYINRSDYVVPDPRIEIQLENGDVAPNTLEITWNDGTARTATDDGKGLITGDATGTIRYRTGEVVLVLPTLPLGGQEFDIEYGWGDAEEESFLAPGATINLAETDITPGTVEVEWQLVAPTVNYGGITYPFAATRIARDDGLGNIKLDGATVASINYATGVITGMTYTANASVPKIQYEWKIRTAVGG